MSFKLSRSSCEAQKESRGSRSAWLSFIKSIASFKGDLASITAPPFLLAPQSIVEFNSYWAEYPELFVAPSHEESAERRALLVAQWFLTTLRRQHASNKKPLNPFLGELFLGHWADGAGNTNLISEQVSHHPPATAYKIWNDTHGVELEGLVAPKAYFSGTVNIERRGYSLLRLARHDETHYITMPPAHVEGLMTFQLNPELGGTSHIVSSAGYTTRIEYSGKGWLGGGQSNSFTATIRGPSPSKDQPLYTLEGQWSGSYTVKDRTGQVIQTVELSALNHTPLQVADLEDQDDLESRRAWRCVADAIRADDMLGVGREKSRIENEQRALRRLERDQGRVWQSRYFSAAEIDPVADELRSAVPATEVAGTKAASGVACWKFDSEKYRSVSAA